jgi:hypothetical protein
MKPLLFPDLYDRLDSELQYVFEERAGIIEFEAHQPRERAECLALLELLRGFPTALLGIRAVQLELQGQRHWLLARPSIAEALSTRHATWQVDLATVLDRSFHGLADLTASPDALREFRHLI